MQLPPILANTGPLLCRFDALICDIWGVVHDGHRAYAPAADALRRYRAQGGTVLLLSNAPMPADAVVHVLDAKGVDRDVTDGIVTSGDITRRHLIETGYRRVHHIGPDRDLVVFSGLDVERVPLNDAEAVVCTGLVDDRRETGDTYRPLLARMAALRLPFICANPDLIVDVGGTFLPCAGTLAAIYEQLGGLVYWAGKPYPVAYESAFRALAGLRASPVDPSRTLAVGDALRTDIAGAAAAGLHALFIAQGIHRHDLLNDQTVDPAKLAAVLRTGPAEAVRAILAVATELAW